MAGRPKRVVWQLDDCWPVLSWSVLDFYGFPKAGYYFLKRAYASLLASFKSLPDGALELWLTNDIAHDVSDHVTVRLATFTGDALWAEARHLAVTAGGSICAWRWAPSEVRPMPDRYVSVRSSSNAFPTNRHFFEKHVLDRAFVHAGRGLAGDLVAVLRSLGVADPRAVVDRG